MGDTAQIQILNDGEADASTEVTRKSASPNLSTSVDLARQLLSAISKLPVCR
jgi:hypothetical protein